MQRIERFLLDAEKRFLPGQAEKRAEEAKYRKLSADQKIADQKAMSFLAELSLPSEKMPIQPLDDQNETTIQLFPIDCNSDTALIIPGFDSTGQSHKYHWLIAELNRHGISVARVNNQPHIDLDPEDFTSGDDYIATHQEMYLTYMTRHFQRIAAFLSDKGQLTDKQLHIIASSAAAPAILALHHLFEPTPQSMVLLGPSGDIDFRQVKPGIDTFVQYEQRQIVIVVGQYDSFMKEEPFVTLSEMARSLPNVSVAMIPRAEHDLRDENIKYLGSKKMDERTIRIFSEPAGGIIQLAIHRECLRALGFPTDHFDEIAGEYPYVYKL